jgi:hypothetical protein
MIGPCRPAAFNEGVAVRHQVRGNDVVFANGRLATLPFPISATAEVDGVVVAVLGLPPGTSMTENVFGLSAEGAILWQVERIPETSSDAIANQYVSIIGSGEGMARVSNWNGVVVDVDVQTGKVKRWYWGK